MNVWDRVYEHYKNQYTKEQVYEMTFAELNELIQEL